ncbi:MAG: hypothetical protein U1E65_31180 [Myxococcota bacterium]
MKPNKDVLKRVMAARERLKEVARRTTERAAASYQGAKEVLDQRDRALVELAAAVPGRLAQARGVGELERIEAERTFGVAAKAKAVDLTMEAKKALDVERKKLEHRARDLEVVERALERLETSIGERERRREQAVLDDLSAQRFGRARR